MRLVASLLLLLTGFGIEAKGQVLDDFSDGDFSANPTWTGTESLWSVVPFGADSAVRLNGIAASDTAYLATPSAIAKGTWKLDVRYEGGRLSNFNQVRVYVTATTSDLTAPMSGYHVQLGTNDRNIRLYKSDPAAPGGRVLLASSIDDLLGLDEATIALEITRSTENEWVISTDGSLVLTHSELSDAIATSTHFGIWVKHSASRNQQYYFDSVDVSDSLPPDETPPSLLSAVYVGATNVVEMQFSETLDPLSVSTSAFSVNNGIGSPQSLEIVDPDALPPGSLVRLTYSATIPSGDYTVTATGIADEIGNVATQLSAEFSAVSDTDPPELLGVAAIDSRHVDVTYSEVVDPSTACVASNYSVSSGIGSPSRVLCPNGAATSVELEYDTPIPGGAYELTVSNISDLSGNTLSSATRSFSILVSGDVPTEGDVVVNEIAYDMSETNLEFVELLNVSTKTFALSEFEFSDNRVSRVPVTTGAEILAPGQYAVLVRDGSLFAAAFPEASFIEPPSWPALNNSGDAAALFFGSTTVDSVSFSPSWGGTDVSLERKDPAGPSNSSSNWSSSIDVTTGTPGRENSVFGPDLSAPRALFAEQVSEFVVRLYFDEPINPGSATPVNFSVAGNPPTSVFLLDGDDALDLHFGAITADILDVSDVSDVTGNTLIEVSIPIARFPEADEIRITELLFDPRSDDSDGLQDQTEFVELFNAGNRTLSLSGLYWTDTPNEDGEADTMQIDVRAAGIAPGGFAVVFAQPSPIPVNEVFSSSDLVLAFPRDYRADGTALLPFSASSLGLLNSGDLFRLHRSDDGVLDEVEYDPDWHQPNLREAKGTSLERIDPDGPSSSANNWSSSVAEMGATPGLENSIHLSFEASDESDGLVITPSPFSPDFDGIDDFAAIYYKLGLARATIRVRIFDSKGRKVRELEPGLITSNAGTVIWDGLDDDGNDLRLGIYIAVLDAIDSDSGATESHKAAVVLARHLN